MHPAKIMARSSAKRPCGRKDKHVEVEDHGNGYMFYGCDDIEQAKRILREYLPKKQAKRFVFAHRRWLSDMRMHALWLADAPMAMWDGYQDWIGRPTRYLGEHPRPSATVEGAARPRKRRAKPSKWGAAQ